jgi:hypothetical protein
MNFKTSAYLRVAVLALLAVGLYFGVFRKKDGTGSGSTLFGSSSATGNSAGKIELSSHDQQMRTKLEPLIKCLNGQLSRYEDELASYHTKVAYLEHRSPSTMTSFMTDLSPTFGDNSGDKGHATNECADQLDKGASLSPSVPDLDANAKTIADQLRKMIGPGLEMDEYVDEKKYLDDKFAKGQQYDATLSPLLASVTTLTEKLRSEIERENSTVRQDELEAIEKHEGRDLRWQTQNCMIAARALDENVLQLARSHSLSPGGVQAAMQPLQAAVDGANAFLQAHPELKEQNRDGQQPLWFSVNTPLVTELSVTRELRQDLEETPEQMQAKQPFPETPEEHQKNIHDQVQKVNDSFNSVIVEYNDGVRDSH